MVPFLTHRSARDLLAAELKNSPQKPSEALINLVGGARALTDMRLIRNIRNEFEIYRASVLGDKGLEGLTADRLFAIMVYKNTHLEDFEAIRLGHERNRQCVQRLPGDGRVPVSSQAARSSQRSPRAGHGQWDKRAKVPGTDFSKCCRSLQRATRRGGEFMLQHASSTYSDV